MSDYNTKYLKTYVHVTEVKAHNKNSRLKNDIIRLIGLLCEQLG
jgi:hypothetical protein